MNAKEWGMRAAAYSGIGAAAMFLWYIGTVVVLSVVELYGWLWGHNIQTWEDDYTKPNGTVDWSVWGSWPHWAIHYPGALFISALPLLIICDGLVVLTWAATRRAVGTQRA